MDISPQVFQVENLGINLNIQQVFSENEDAENVEEGKSIPIIVDEDTNNLNSNYEIPKDIQGPIIMDEDTVNLNLNSDIYKDMQGLVIMDEVAEKFKFKL